MKSKKNGFTLVELLLVLTIITLLVALLIPSLAMVRRIARETKQKAQLVSIDMALLAFKNDQGDYPDSFMNTSIPNRYYCGAQKLSEALLGFDLLGFHSGSSWVGDITGTVYDMSDLTELRKQDNLNERKGPYLELGTANAFRLGNISYNKPGLFDLSLFDATRPLAPDTFVLCDAFAKNKITQSDGKIVNAGTPILYYKANTTSKTIEIGNPIFGGRIYNVYDNDFLVRLIDPYTPLRYLANPANTYRFFYNYITDPKITARLWPHRADSYILITAGADGLYGTADDICNFGN